LTGTSTVVGGAALAAGTLVAASWLRRRPFSFRGKTVVIFGGSRGLGLVLARIFADEGARLMLVARHRGELDRARRDIEQRGGTAVVVPCDVCDPEDVASAIQTAVSRFGGIDVLVNDAGIMQAGPFEHMTDEDFEAALGVHLWGPLRAMRAALPYLRGGGRIVNVASIGGKIPVPHMLPYVASKFALVGLSEALSAELAKDGVSVTTVCPGLMRTGSPRHATFKGRHAREHAWFAISAAMPLLSISAERAARRIVEACRRRRPVLIITPQARLAAALHGVAPGLLVRALGVVARLLPSPTGPEGDRSRRGAESASWAAPSVLTRLSDRAALENNEL
jgi:NAD(P)-dependent dehydrogenase (short-subunit alcohol dehydrogenase family)